MTERDRLIELIGTVQSIGVKYTHEETASSMGFRGNAELADYLLANGVIVPPCKVGDDVYWIDTETNEINCAENDIKAICYYGEGKFKVIVQDENTPEDIGTEWCMLTKEEAEEKLKELGK